MFWFLVLTGFMENIGSDMWGIIVGEQTGKEMLSV